MADKWATSKQEKGLLRIGIPVSVGVLICWVILSLPSPSHQTRPKNNWPGLFFVAPLGMVLTRTENKEKRTEGTEKRKVTWKLVVGWQDWAGLILLTIVIYAICSGINPVALLREIRDALSH